MRAKDAIWYVQQMDPEEPVFILRGQDILAPDTVRHWAILALAADVSPTAKVREARAWALVMEKWEPRKLPD